MLLSPDMLGSGWSEQGIQDTCINTVTIQSPRQRGTKKIEHANDGPAHTVVIQLQNCRRCRLRKPKPTGSPQLLLRERWNFNHQEPRTKNFQTTTTHNSFPIRLASLQSLRAYEASGDLLQKPRCCLIVDTAVLSFLHWCSRHVLL